MARRVPKTRLRIQELIAADGMSMLALSVRSGVRYATIWENANGRGNPTLATLEMIADALRVDVRDLIVPQTESEAT